MIIGGGLIGFFIELRELRGLVWVIGLNEGVSSGWEGIGRLCGCWCFMCVGGGGGGVGVRCGVFRIGGEWCWGGEIKLWVFL